MSELPEGTVTFLFTDIEGSTRLLEELGGRYVDALAEHRRIVREACVRHGGIEVDTQGDAFFVVFTNAGPAARAAAEAQEELASGPMRVRMGLHTGQPIVWAEGYAGVDVHRAARICAAGHGGQVLLSAATRRLITEELRDLGEHRLKDLPKPEWLFQLGRAEFPPLRSLNNTNLPAEASSLVGRRREIDELTRLFRDEGRRLVTLTGPGGSGKTRLALRVAAELVERFGNGVFLVPLASIDDPALVAPTIARTIGASEQDAESTVEAIVRDLGDKQLLLCLDNFEQVVAGAGIVTELLAGAPGLCVLATSREPLCLSGEHEYPVSPLPVADAVRLFGERAREAGAGSELDEQTVREICARLDALPLAIELVAARAKLLPPPAILERLESRLSLVVGGRRDLPVRHQTLRGTIEWSYELLAESERALFASLGIFAGGWTIDAAEAICDASLDGLGSLAGKSLIQVSDEGRFFMLETIREYALERLSVGTDAERRRRVHADYFLALAEDSADDEASRLDRLELEHENLRATLAWALAEGSTEDQLGLRLAGALGRFWYVRAYPLEGSIWLERALSAEPDGEPAMRAKAIYSLGVLADERGDLEEAARLLEESSELWQASGDRRRFATALNSLAVVARNRGDLERARALFEQSLQLKRQFGELAEISTTTCGLGTLAIDEGKFDEARVLLEESLTIDRQLGDRLGAAINLGNLAAVALEMCYFGDARQLAVEALEAFRSLRDHDGVAEGLEQLACIAAGENDPGLAARLAGAASALRASIGMPLTPTDQGRLDRHLAAARDTLGPAGFETAFAEGNELPPEAAIAEALASKKR